MSSCPSPEMLSRFVADGSDLDISAHVATCDMCSAEVEAHRAVSDDIRRLPVYEPSPEHVRDVRAALVAAARTMPASAPVVSLASRRTVIAAGALLAAAAVALLVIRPFSSKPDVTAVYRGEIHPHDGAQFIRVGAEPDEIVRLTRGTITVEVAKLQPNERFRVITDDSEVEVRGTAFDVTAVDDHLSAVHVLHGKVEVRASGAQAVFLGAGERWEPELARNDQMLSPTAPPVAAAPQVGSAAPNTVAAILDDGKPLGFYVDTAPELYARNHAAKEQAAGKKSAAKTVAAKQVVVPSETPAARPSTSKTASMPATTIVAPTAKAPDATSANATKATQQITVAQHPPPVTQKRANEQQFDKGWTAMNANDFAEAATRFEQAAKAAPNDPLAEDAWFWRASALTRAKSSSAVSALDAFITRYPHSPRAGEASAMLGWLLLDRDTDRAEKLFTSAASDRVAAVRASGEKGLAAVAQKRANAH